jgi:hypothetical protein
MSNTNQDYSTTTNSNPSKLDAFKAKIQSKANVNTPQNLDNSTDQPSTPKPKMPKTPEADEGMSALSQLTRQAIRFFSK